LTATELALTAATSHQAGSAFWPQAIDPRNMTVEYEATIGGGTGADGLALVFADASKGATPTSLGETGGGLGFGGIPGIALGFGTYKGAAAANFVGVSDGKGTEAKTLHWLGTANVTPSLRATHKIKVSTAGGAIALWIDGSKIGSLAVALPSKSYIGFSAATGGLDDRHAIAHLLVS
jgi:hypothetical protein